MASSLVTSQVKFILDVIVLLLAFVVKLALLKVYDAVRQVNKNRVNRERFDLFYSALFFQDLDKLHENRISSFLFT